MGISFTTTQSFSTGEEVTAAKLNNIVGGLSASSITESDLDSNLALLYISSSEPSASDGRLWYDTSNKIFKGCIGSTYYIRGNLDRDIYVRKASNTSVDISAEFLSVNGWQLDSSQVSLTADITTSGANGLDTGTEAASTWYYVFVILGSSGIASLLSTSRTAPTLPSGYIMSRLVGIIYNDSSSDFVDLMCDGLSGWCNYYNADGATVLNGVTATTSWSTAIDISAAIPTHVRRMLVRGYSSSSAEGLLLMIAYSDTGGGALTFSNYWNTGTKQSIAYAETVWGGGTNLYYKVNYGSNYDNQSLDIIGFKIF